MVSWNSLSLIWEFGVCDAQVKFTTNASGGSVAGKRGAVAMVIIYHYMSGRELDKAGITWKELLPIVITAAV